MKFLERLSFAAVTAVGCGAIAALVQFLVFEEAWRSIVVFCLTAAFAYFFARWKLKRMNQEPDCTWTEFHVAAKRRRSGQ